MKTAADITRVTAAPVGNKGKVELTAHMADGSTEVIAKSVTNRGFAQLYSERVNLNAAQDTLAQQFTFGKTVSSWAKEFNLKTFTIEAV